MWCKGGSMNVPVGLSVSLPEWKPTILAPGEAMGPEPTSMGCMVLLLWSCWLSSPLFNLPARSVAAQARHQGLMIRD